MAKLLGTVFLMVAVIMLLFIGMDSITSTTNNVNISVNDTAYDDFQTAKNATATAFMIGGVFPYFFAIMLLIGISIALMSAAKRR
ncbi:MAG: hypothetical protein LAKADJCE_00934 [Candidatus Argoarchaeum ethanivorans]|uniref:Uncharacterized protein n=1 Tax=Candidatus Argoarchaeum ethanivorans TaxID=2608793 RepID=A0A811TGA7_9EURY|nr:MAG: hypothetical protein LAKADJCE_00934 [Candidatus Argoarchaeum ethanivorans]